MEAQNTKNDELRPRAVINLNIIRDNYAALKTFAAGAETAAVVKADAYGHGVRQVAKTLSDAGCSTFFVAYLSEAIELRSILDASADIIVLNGFQEPQLSKYSDFNLIPVCNQLSELAALRNAEYTSKYILHFDTGMNRLGLLHDDLDEVSEFTNAAPPYMIMSHLACADKPEDEANSTQLQKFVEICGQFPSSKKSLAATGGIYLGSEYHFDLVRPGIGLFGGGPARPLSVNLTTALTLTAPILKTFSVKAGEPIGYGATYSPKFDSLIATVALGYADGFLRSGSNYGFGVLDGIPCPIVGRVSMDLIMLDITDLPAKPQIGDEIEFIGQQAGYEIQAEALGTISYELTTRLGHRIYRAWGDEE